VSGILAVGIVVGVLLVFVAGFIAGNDSRS
jgi:hypothetical protein